MSNYLNERSLYTEQSRQEHRGVWDAREKESRVHNHEQANTGLKGITSVNYLLYGGNRVRVFWLKQMVGFGPIMGEVDDQMPIECWY